MRRQLTFPCAGETLAGTLDAGTRASGLLIVSGGNEVRAGAHRGMALLAQALAAEGTPVLRYDRRGVGDSSGENCGYLSSAPDIAAAAAVFRREQPQLTRLIGFGNCDAATALALFSAAAGVERLVLANPWVVESAAGELPPAAVRAHYRARLADPRQWWRLLRGEVKLKNVVSSLRQAADTEREDALVKRFAAAVPKQAHVVLARGDATAIGYADAARRIRLTLPTTWIESHSHSFSRPGDATTLAAVIRQALATHPSPRT